MARGRMIDKCISISEKINDLTIKEALIYTWIIPHLDDWGRISGSPRTLKALIFPMKKEISIKDIENALTEFSDIGLFQWAVVDDIQVLQQPFEEFNNHQSISDNKRGKSNFPEIPKNPQEMPGIPSLIKVNLIKENISKDKGTRHLDNVFLLDEEYQKLIDLLGESKTKDMIEKLDLYIGSKGDKYKSHYKTILNWIRMEKEKNVTSEPKTLYKKVL